MADSNPPKPAATPTPPATPAAAGASPVLEPPTRSISRRDDKVSYEYPATRRSAWRDKLSEGFRTFLWVAPLTALIWIYAERAQIAPLEVRAKIAVRSTSPDRVVTIISPTDRYVTLDLRAPRAGLDAVRERLTTAREIEVTIPDDIAPGFEGDILVTDRIERNPIFQEWAVDVERSFPPVRIKVEKKVTRTLPLARRPEDSSFASVKFDPPSITIEGPQSYIDRIKPDQAAYTDLEKLREYKPDTYTELVNVIGFAEENVVKTPARVSATVEIRQGEKEILNAVGVEVILPATQLKEASRLSTPVTLVNVEVTGPPAQLARLRQESTDRFLPKVVVRIDPADFSQTRLIKRITAENYVLPPDVTVVNPNREIAFTVEPR